MLSLLLVGAMAALANAQRCPVGSAPFIPNQFPNDLSSFNYNEAGLQIFTQLEFPCDGIITEWRYLLHKSKPALVGAHLAVFRPVGNGRFAQVGETYIANEPSVGDWAAHMLDTPIAVRQGDVVGLYYDNLIDAAIGTQPYKLSRPTLIDVKTAQYVADNNYIIDMSESDTDKRIPAIVAVLEQAMTTTTTTPPPATTTKAWPTWPTWLSLPASIETIAPIDTTLAPSPDAATTQRWWWTWPTGATEKTPPASIPSGRPNSWVPNLPGLFAAIPGLGLRPGSSQFQSQPNIPGLNNAGRPSSLLSQRQRPAFLQRFGMPSAQAGSPHSASVLQQQVLQGVVSASQ